MRKETSHFWVGRFEVTEDFQAFLEENDNYYQEQEDNKEVYLSEFAASQHQQWFDHDFMEVGFEDDDKPFAERFAGYSYAEQWMPQLQGMVDNELLQRSNALIFITAGEIRQPVSVQGPGFVLHYVGQITYDI